MIRRSILLLTIILAFVALARAEDSDVKVLTKSDFKSTIEKEDLILVEFYAPWCGHCKALAPEYEKAATELKSSGIPIAKVDCTVEEEVCQQQEVRGYPTLKVFRGGAPSEFKGQRKADSIVSYMKKQALPALSEVTSKNVEDLIESDKVVVIGFFKKSDSAEYKAFAAAANKQRDDYIFGASVESDVASKYDVKAPAIILFKKFDEGKAVYDGAWEEADIEKFVKNAATPLMDELGPENYSKYVETGLPLAYLFYGGEDERKKVAPLVESVAKEFKGKINFVTIDGSKYGAHGKNLGLEESWPGFVIQQYEEGTKFPFSQKSKITTEGIREFVKDFVDGKLTPFLKSQDVPESNDGPVKTIVGTEFDKIVLPQDEDVFVEFYAPWCGHCQRLAPIWDELGEKYKSVKGVTIAKMDATENDIPPSSPFKQIQGFPTLILFKAGSDPKEFVNYEGPRTLDSLVEFMETNASHKGGFEVKPTEEEDEDDDEPKHDEL